LNATVVAKKRQAMVIDEKIISKFFFLKFLISVGHVVLSFKTPNPKSRNLGLPLLPLPSEDRQVFIPITWGHLSEHFGK